jgi:hypothetical protein
VRPRHTLRPWDLAALLWALGYALVNATAALPGNPQLWWQVRQGELTLSTGRAVLAHSWSWTAGDVTWIPNSWGWGVLLAVGYRGAGFPGVVVLVVLAQLAVLGFAWHVFDRLGLRAGPLRLGLLVLLSLSMAGWADGQSELADYLAVFAFAAVCLSRRLRALGSLRRRRALGAAALVIAARGENLHLGGLAAIAVFAAVLVICEGASRGLLLVAAGAALGVLATPSGAAGIAKSLATAAASKAEDYAAWEPLFAQPGSYNYEPALLALAIGAAALAAVLWRRDWVTAGILALAMISTCVVVRSGSDLVMLSLIAGVRVLARLRTRRMPRLSRLAVLGAPALAAGWLVVAVCVAAASVTPGWRLAGIDPSDLAAIPHGARVFSTIGASDVIDALRPDLQVTIDSRNDLYPVSTFEYAKSLTTTRVADAPDYFEDNGVTAVFLRGAPARESRTRLATTLTDAGWSSSPGVTGLVLLAPAR